MKRAPPRTTRNDSLFPCSTLFRSNQRFRFVGAVYERSGENLRAAGSTDRSLEKIQFLLRQIEDEEERLLRARDGMMATAAEDSERYVLILGFLGIAVLGLAGGAIGLVIALSANLGVKDIRSKLADEIRSNEERKRRGKGG